MHIDSFLKNGLFSPQDLERVESAALHALAKFHGLTDIELKSDVELGFDLVDMTGYKEYKDFVVAYWEWYQECKALGEWREKVGDATPLPGDKAAQLKKAMDKRDSTRNAFKAVIGMK